MFETLEKLFPYMSAKRIRLLIGKKTIYLPRLKKEKSIDVHALERNYKRCETNVSKLEYCMTLHAERVLSTKNPRILASELVNLLVEAEMKRLNLAAMVEIKKNLRKQKKIVSYISTSKKEKQDK